MDLAVPMEIERSDRDPPSPTESNRGLGPPKYEEAGRGALEK